MAILSADELTSSLNGLSGWQAIDGSLQRTFIMPSFMAALDLVNRVGEMAEAAGHHPDITINYNRVTFALTTHDDGGITQKDVDLATQIEGAAA